MSVINQNLLLTPEGYQISRSVRTRSSASAYFGRTPASSTSRTIWTWSGWVKRGTLGADQALFSADSTTGGGGIPRCELYFSSTDKIAFSNNVTGSAWVDLISTAVYRDPSAWYHVVCAVDTTQATAANRVKLYVNGSQVTSFSTSGYPAQNDTTTINSTGPHSIARYQNGASQYFDGYLTEINFIDGQALTPSSFGQTNTVTGVWQPLKYTGTYGTNGFYLNFSDNSNNTATTIGKDYSGNGNNWTPNNISVTAGATYDSMLDVPTLFADGGNGRGNYAVLNPLDNIIGIIGTLSNGNLTASSGTGAWNRSSIALLTNQKTYAEYTSASITGGNPWFGIYQNGSLYYIYSNNGQINVNGSVVATVATWTVGDTIAVTWDDITGQASAYKNGTLVDGPRTLSGMTGDKFFALYNPNSSCNVNFGQRPFTYTPPTGFVALNTQNLPTPTISNGANYMAATTYTGTGSALTIANTVNGISFQPDFVWVKGRSGATDHALYDSVRGVQKQVESNTTTAETTETTGLTAFGSTGFTVGALAQMNTNAATYVGWQWLAGTTSSSNTNGSITSTVSVGATQGFSVVTYTGTGANATVGHGLGVAPKMIFGKNRTSGTPGWPVYHASIGNTGALILNSTAATDTSSAYWNNTSPTSSVFSIGTGTSVNTSTQNYVFYCFSEVAGYSKFGSYTGNGSADGPFVYCGFRPRFVMLKNISLADTAWIIYDNQRDGFNETEQVLNPNSSIAEATYATTGVDMLSNGFKLRGTSSWHGSSGQTVIFAAFAENPTKFSLAR